MLDPRVSCVTRFKSMLKLTKTKQDEAKAEPPETPAPVFAIRAFKSALFGTPGGEEDDGDQSVVAASQESPTRRTMVRQAEQPADQGKDQRKEDRMPTTQPAQSPTKSILVTPGTTSNRRKTVSFGETILHSDSDRERREAPRPASMVLPSSQWMASGLEAKPRPKSRLTQSFLEVREQSTKGTKKSESTAKDENKIVKKEPGDDVFMATDESQDETVNLEEPQSRSGKYWKAEYESYRERTSQEMRKLIQYRSAAKSYARKKDAEALRLTEKLRQEEAKVADMERQVAGLASDMVGVTDSDKEQLIQELAKQTALAVQYKHKVDNLRKALERHGVVGPEDQTETEQPEDELERVQRELAQAREKIAELEKENRELAELRELAQSSERKAQELEKENAQLKQSLARVKQEMVKYEGRRKERESKLKQREAKLEARNQEFRQRIKEYRDMQDTLKRTIHEERKIHMEKIAALQNHIRALQQDDSMNSADPYAHRSEIPGVQAQDFALQHDYPNKLYRGQHQALEAAGGRRPMTYYSRNRIPSPIENGEENSSVIIAVHGSPRRATRQRRSNSLPSDNGILPSSPPISPLRVPGKTINPPNRGRTEPSSARSSTAAAPIVTQTNGNHVHHPPHPQQPPRRHPLHTKDRHSPFENVPPLQPNGTRKRETNLSPDREAAARARLQQKAESRRRGEGKENMRELFV